MSRRERLAPSIMLPFVAFFADTLNWAAVDWAHFSIDLSRILPSSWGKWLLFAGTIVVVAAANAMYPWLTRLSEHKRKKLFLLVSIFTDLGILGVFKYFNFFAASIESAILSLGGRPMSLHLDLLLPIGISFYTFETLSYTIDVYKGKMRPTHRYSVYALFLAFFPRLVAGPIVRSEDLIPQFSAPRKIQFDQTARGVFLIILGFFKKVAIADGVAPSVNAIFNSTGAVSWIDIILATLLFAIQVYCDFSGYSDISRGVAKFFGIELMVNFKLPYFSKSPGEFWKRWHISLSTWLRDYLYINFGGDRKGKLKTYRNLMLTMALGGLWHGAAWNYVLWGVYQGAIQMLYKIFGFATTGDLEERKRFTPLSAVVRTLICFLFTLYGWLLFRANSLDQIVLFSSSLFTDFGNFAMTIPKPTLGAIIGIPILILYEWTEYNSDSVHFYRRLSPVIQGAMYATFAILILMGASNAPAQFIYFQF